MVKVRKNLVGQKFGRLMVIGRAEDGVQPNGQYRARWWCQCECGSEPIVVFGYNLNRNNGTTSCGCLVKETVAAKSIKGNKYDLSGDFGICYSSNTMNKIYFDLEDYDLIKNYCWYENNQGYAMARIRGKDEHVLMHNLIFKKYCDHIDRNRLNNVKSNLRAATYSENNQNRSLRTNNTSGIAGVSFSTSDNKWIAQLTINYKHLYYEKFNNKEDAIKARLKAEKKYYGEFAPQKHLYQKYNID